MSRTALVVEDDISIRHLVRAALTGHGYDVVEAGDGTSALTAAAASLPDVILLDIGLPDMDGLTVLKKVKSDPDLRAVPVVMVTAWADPDMVRVAMDRGAADYVCKPFAVDDLLARVDATGAAPESVVSGDTGLPNREHLEMVLDRECRTERPCAVVLVDVDDFDGIVATHGHELGNDVLEAIARRFRQRAGMFDTIVRYGSSSLAVVLPGADALGASARAETLREALADAPVATVTATLRVTAAFGVASSDGRLAADELLSRATDALAESVTA